MTIGGGISLPELVAAVLASTAVLPSIPIRIEFEAPEDCSSLREFYDGVRARTDRVHLAQGDELGLKLRVKLRASGGKVHGELRGIDEQGETEARIVDGASCQEVVEALSLTAALALDPNARLSVSRPSAEAELPSSLGMAEFTRDATSDAAAAESAPSAPLQFAFELGAEFVAAEVISPELNVGAGVFARVTLDRASVLSPALSLALLHLRNDLVASPEKAEVTWTAAEVMACPLRWQLSNRYQIQPCGLLLAGRLAASGHGVRNPEEVSRSWWSAGLLARLGVALGSRSTFQLRVGVSAPLVRRRFITTSPDKPAGETPRLAALAGLGLGYEF